MRKSPLVPVALALMAGIIAACHLDWPATTWAWTLAGCALATGTTLLVFKQLHTVSLWMAILFCGLAGGLLTTLKLQRDWTRDCPEKTFLEVRLTETPTPREKSWRAKARVLSGGDITLFLRKDSIAATLRYGDRLLLHGYPDTRRRSIYITSDHYLVTGHDTTSLRARCEQVRLHLLRRMQAGPLEPRQAGVAEAMTLGWRSDLAPATQSAFRDAGIAHLLAVSGLHVGLLAAIVGALLFWLSKERRGRLIRGSIQLAVVWIFALLTGWAPSTIRAALMFSLFIVAGITARRTPSFNLLAAAAIVTLVANPLLINDIGWQLSYSAVGGILLARPVIMAFRNWLWQATAVSTFATLATLPVVATTFHRLPVYFLIANIFIVPLAGIMLFLSLVYMALPCSLTAWPLHWIILLCEWLTSWVASLPGAVVEI